MDDKSKSCRNCRDELPDAARFCPACGTLIDPPDPRKFIALTMMMLGSVLYFAGDL